MDWSTDNTVSVVAIVASMVIPLGILWLTLRHQNEQRRAERRTEAYMLLAEHTVRLR